MRRRVWALCLGLVLLLGGCRGGGWVFKGFHEDQDRALLEQLAEDYPKMGFRCTGQTGGSRHTLLADDGTEFPAWTAAASEGRFQIMEHYLEEWLAGEGFYRELEDKLAELGFTWEYESYNYYDRHFAYGFGPLDEPERRESAALVLDWAKERFDSLYAGFQENTGCEAPLLYFNGSFTLEGEEHFRMFYLSMRREDRWGREYPYDDYRALLEDAAEQSKNSQAIPED